MKDVKLSFFNGTASNVSKFSNTSVFTGTNASLVAGNDIFDNLSLITVLYPFLGSTLKIYNTQVIDDSYGTAGINLAGRPESEVLCSKCHYRHGLDSTAGVNLTHGRNNVTNSSETATCVDCHMSNAGGKTDHSFDAKDATNYPQYTCSKGTNCHVTSAENVNLSNLSIVPIETEWKATAHNDREISYNKSSNSSFYFNATSGTVKSRQNSCLKCHSPFDWNPATDSNTTNVQLSSDFKGIVCNVCHNIHDMGDWINETGKVYGWYNRDAINNSGVYQANYTVMDNTTELCGNCHSNIRIGNTGPGWASSASTTPIKPHGYPAKDVFVGCGSRQAT